MKLRIFWDDLRATLWFRPALWLGGLLVLALLLLEMDQRLTAYEVAITLPWLYVDSAEGARTMLGAIGSAMLTVATLAFSILMVAVVQTANAYSPRILRQYLSDTNNQHVMGILVGTFLYTLLVLRRVQGSDEDLFIPMVSISAALGLALLSVLAFVYFINHVAHSIEVSAVLQNIHRESAALLPDLFPDSIGQPWVGEGIPRPPGVATVVLSRWDGYVEAINGEALLDLAVEADAVIEMERFVGDFVLLQTPLATVWMRGIVSAEMVRRVQDAVTLGVERTMVQDLHYGARQLSDMALRAISTSVNDPSTAVNCLDVLGRLLGEVARRPVVSPYRCDDQGQLRLIAHGVTFESLLDLAFTQIRQYGGKDWACTVRLIEVCTELGYVVGQEEERAALWRHVGMMARAADRSIQEPWDRWLVNQQLRAAGQVLGQVAGPLLLSVDSAVVNVEATPSLPLHG